MEKFETKRFKGLDFCFPRFLIFPLDIIDANINFGSTIFTMKTIVSD